MKTKNYKGITLIALIITIIVLLILAGVSISLVVGDNGVLGQAVNATTATDVAETKEAIELAVIGYLDSNGDYTIKDVEKAVADAGATLGSDGVTVTTAKGNTVDISDLVAGAKLSWYYVDDTHTTMTNGIKTVTIGDYIDYDPGDSGSYTSKGSATGMNSYINDGSTYNQTFNVSDYSGDWRIIGVDEDTGELLILSDVFYVSESDLDSNSYGSWYYFFGQEGFTNCVNELNNICAIYGNGYGASGARSVTQEDIDNLAGYDPDNPGDNLYTVGENDDGTSEVWRHGATVEIYWDGDMDPHFYSSTGDDGDLAGHNTITTYTPTKTGFIYFDFDTNTWKTSYYAENLTAAQESEVYITSITNNSYYYYADDYFDTDTDEFAKWLFYDDGGDYLYYWLGSRYWLCSSGYAYWGCRDVHEGYVGGWNFVYSNGYGYCYGESVRAVVSLESDISLVDGTSGNWSIE